MLPCAWKQFLGISCPMCGFQRSVIKLLEGDLAGSFPAFPPLTVFAASLIYIAALRLIHLKNHTTLNAPKIKVLAIINIAALVFNFFYQNFLYKHIQ
jgi:hypothetical protein